MSTEKGEWGRRKEEEKKETTCLPCGLSLKVEGAFGVFDENVKKVL